MVKLPLLLLVSVAVICVGGVTGDPCASKDTQYAINEEDTIKEVKRINYQGCRNSCKNDENCFVWTWSEADRQCKMGVNPCKPGSGPCVGNAASYKAGVYSGYSSATGCHKGYKDLGCWKNKVPQSLVNMENEPRLVRNYKQRNAAVNKCFQVSKDRGFPFFAVGNNGQCWAGHGEDYKTYGAAEECPKDGRGKYGVVHVYEIAAESCFIEYAKQSSEKEIHPIATEEECRSMCESNEGCKMWKYEDKTNVTCSLYPAGDDVFGPAECPRGVMIRTEERSYRSGRFDTAEECQAKCKDTEGCVAFGWQKSKRQCHRHQAGNARVFGNVHED